MAYRVICVRRTLQLRSSVDFVNTTQTSTKNIQIVFGIQKVSREDLI